METTLRRRWRGFWQLADPKIWIASTVPLLIATALAYADTGSLPVGWIVAALVGIYLIEIGKNAVNEFIDYYTGVDRYVTADRRTPFSGGKKTIIDGRLTLGETALIALVTLAAAFIVGVLIAWFREPHVFWIGMIGGVLAVAYSLPPFKLNYNGLGEFAVGLAFGPLLLSGMYVMLTGRLDLKVVLIGVPIAFLVMAILWINQYPDYEADIRGGKRNGLVRIGKRPGLFVFGGLFVCTYLSLPVLAWLTGNLYWLLGLVTIPLAWRTVRSAVRHLDDLPRFLAANAGTIQLYQLMGLTMLAAALLGG
ncbi:prenyltransferase [Paenibacillus daejeonensis]|uniref:prenyltransferase n=1 Tax=Paenibacillus daejeonensis TaxID=135193 RepID=UPI000374AF83|nr:prenyltransferase [Paenibacillus daejeonensis]